MIRVLALCGSLRKDSYNLKLLQAIEKLHIFSLEFFDLATLPFFNEDLDIPENLPSSVKHLLEAIKDIDGILIATPEYDWSIPGVLKNAIDWLSSNQRNIFPHIPIAVIGASSGGFGTVRAQMHLKQILFHLDAYVLNKPEILVSNEQESISSQGEPSSDLEKKLLAFSEAFKTFITEHKDNK